MTNTPYNPNTQGGENQHQKTFQASDIKALIQKQGKTTIGDKEVTLKAPSATDPKLQEIIKDPSFTVKPVGNPSSNGECEYDLTANGQSVKIKVDCKSCK
ncbi:MAG: hypothetical protein H0X26_09230 [Alphaproteobacteria bacterium]|nr:hypothetical protein [Alphaproteobacteria bacterium]